MGGKEDDPKEPKKVAKPEPTAPGAEQPLAGETETLSETGTEGAGMQTAFEDEEAGAAEAAGLPMAEVPLPSAASATTLPPFSPEAYEPPSPAKPSEALIQKEALPPDAELVEHFVTNVRLDGLWKRADTITGQLSTGIHTLDIARSLLDQIKYARNYLLAGRGFYEEAERHVNEVEFRVAQNTQSRKWSLTIGVPLFIYEIVFGISLIIVYLSLTTPVFAGFSPDVINLIATMVCGGLGGVTGAWFALIKHISQDQDFDKQHALWYLTSPLMGSVIGAFIYWVMRAGLISLTAGQAQTIASPYIIYILAWLAGYQHNIFTSIVKRIIKVFEVGSAQDESKPSEQKPQEPPPPQVAILPQSTEENPSKSE